MRKSIVREYKRHYGTRWLALKNNIKNLNKVVSLHDKIIIKNLIPGPTLFLNIVGLQYSGIVDISINDTNLNYQHNYQPIKYKNLVMLNDTIFKYKTLDQIANILTTLTQLHLEPGGRLIVGFNYQFIKFNRLKYNYTMLIAKWIDNLHHNRLNLTYNLTTTLPKTNDYGDNLFILTYE